MHRLLSVRLAILVVAILATAIPVAADHERAFKGYADVVVTGFEPLPPFPPAYVRLTGTATGEATHLGSYTRTETLTLKIADGSISGSIVFTAANGDELWADVEGGFTNLEMTRAEGTYAFTGGTGRFQNASGGAAFVAVAVAGGFKITFDGSIQY